MRLLAVLVLAMLLFGCGAATFTGRFVSDTNLFRGPGGQLERVEMNLTQNGSSAIGSFTSQTGSSGQVNAQINGNTVSSMNITIQNGGSSCTMTGSGTYSSFYLNMQLVGSTGCTSGSNPINVTFQKAP